MNSLDRQRVGIFTALIEDDSVNLPTLGPRDAHRALAVTIECYRLLQLFQRLATENSAPFFFSFLETVRAECTAQGREMRLPGTHRMLNFDNSRG